MKEEIRYPVTVSITCPIGGEKKTGSIKTTRKLGEEHAAIIDALMLALKDSPKADAASEALINAGISKGPKQGSLFKNDPTGDGEPYDDGVDPEEDEAPVGAPKKTPKKPRRKKAE
jgi:hypothetical protein